MLVRFWQTIKRWGYHFVPYRPKDVEEFMLLMRREGVTQYFARLEYVSGIPPVSVMDPRLEAMSFDGYFRIRAWAQLESGQKLIYVFEGNWRTWIQHHSSGTAIDRAGKDCFAQFDDQVVGYIRRWVEAELTEVEPTDALAQGCWDARQQKKRNLRLVSGSGGIQ